MRNGCSSLCALVDGLSRECVIVVMDADRRKGNVDAFRWALKHLVRPRDTVVVLGVLCDLGRKSNCFPFDMGIRMPGVWEKLELAGAQGEINPHDIEEEIDKKREEYHSRFQPFYKQCKKNEVKLEIKLAAGFCAKNIAVEEWKRSNSRWIVLDSNLRKSKVYIYGHVDCNVAVMKGKDFATLMPSKTSRQGYFPSQPEENHNGNDDGNDDDDDDNDDGVEQGEEIGTSEKMATAHSHSPCGYPLSWKTGFPRSFTLRELEVITSDFADDEIVGMYMGDISVYQGLLEETPVMVTRFQATDARFWPMLRILTRVRHRNIHGLVGYCCTSDFLFVMVDFPCTGSLKHYLMHDKYAKTMSWTARWHIAQGIGAGLRYLHEECADGPIAHLSVSSVSVLLRHGWFSTLANLINAKCLKDEAPEEGGDLTREKDERLNVDVHDYGVLLLELITGKSVRQYDAKSLVERALPHLENGTLDQLMDPRLAESRGGDENVDVIVKRMARAAFLCVDKDATHRFSMSEVLAVVRGDELACVEM